MANEFTMKLFGCQSTGANGFFAAFKKAEMESFATEINTCSPFLSASAGIVCRKVGLCAFKPSPFSRLGIVVENGLQIGLGDKFGFSQRSAPSDRG